MTERQDRMEDEGSLEGLAEVLRSDLLTDAGYVHAATSERAYAYIYKHVPEYAKREMRRAEGLYREPRARENYWVSRAEHSARMREIDRGAELSALGFSGDLDEDAQYLRRVLLVDQKLYARLLQKLAVLVGAVDYLCEVMYWGINAGLFAGSPLSLSFSAYKRPPTPQSLEAIARRNAKKEATAARKLRKRQVEACVSDGIRRASQEFLDAQVGVSTYGRASIDVVKLYRVLATPRLVKEFLAYAEARAMNYALQSEDPEVPMEVKKQFVLMRKKPRSKAGAQPVAAGAA